MKLTKRLPRDHRDMQMALSAKRAAETTARRIDAERAARDERAAAKKKEQQEWGLIIFGFVAGIFVTACVVAAFHGGFC
jgi:F0F1-type ATP synthase assembly protein I